MNTRAAFARTMLMALGMLAAAAVAAQEQEAPVETVPVDDTDASTDAQPSAAE
jgi:hypothetical protein